MDHNRSKTYAIQNKIGFHYFPDSLHYRDEDLDRWLPVLKQLDARWLVLKSSTTCAIPENFIKALKQARIIPVIDFDLPLSSDIPWKDIRTLLNTYGKWGANYALLNQRPNSQAAWGEKFWKKGDLVDAHSADFIKFGKMALDSGIKPIFSPLVPAGDYWDAAFLESALKILKEKAPSLLLNNMVLSAFAWDHNRPLNWGAGGSQVWKNVKAYKVPKNSQDQRGFRAFEWYAESSRKVLGKTLPIMLFQAGISRDPLQASNKKATTDNTNRQLLYRLLRGENVYDPGNGAKLIKAVAPQVLACSFYLLSSDDPQSRACSWFTPDGLPVNTTRSILRKYRQVEKGQNHTPRTIKTPRAKSTGRQKDQNFKYQRYILVSEALKPRMQEILKKMHAYITRSKPVIGFSCQEAARSASVLVIANPHDFSEQDLQSLYRQGSRVRLLQPENLQANIQQTSNRGRQ
jgi:hypothetical protein